MHFIIKQISRLPFCVLYAISDMVYVILYCIIGYRKKIVRKNLSSAFPEKTQKELRDIERKFYHWLCDYFVETVKLLTIIPEQMKQHLEFRGMEKLTDAYDRGQGAAVFLGHYCNWEWLSAVGLYYPKEYSHVFSGLIYHPLRNDFMDNLMKEARASLGGTPVPKRDILRQLVVLKREKRPYLFGYIFDQAPKWENIHLWTPFLNHNTPVFTGAERIAKKMNDRVVFVRMERPKRGKYVATFDVVSENASQEPEYEITRRCLALLEDSIRKAPHLYLWSHNRWKRTYEGYLKWKQTIPHAHSVTG